MRKFLLPFFLLLSIFPKAQTRVPLKIILSGQVEKGINATAVLFTLPDSAKFFTGIIKDSAIVQVYPNTTYFLRITAIGMSAFEKEIFSGTGSSVINVPLVNVSKNLDQVVIVSTKKKLLTQEDDKTIVDAEVLASSSSNALEILEKTPGAIIDQDGNVYLSSTTPATVYINGREMKLSASDIASLLKNLPASAVSKIEILRTPSAKYDAASSGGIVNIVLKKGIKLGTNGSANVNSFQGKYNSTSAGFNLNNGSGNLNEYLSYQFSNNNNFQQLNSTRLVKTDSVIIAQNAYTTYPGQSHFISGGLSYELSKSFSANYDGRLSLSNGSSYAVNASDLSKNIQQNIIGKSNSDITNKNHAFNFDNSLSTKYKIDSLGSEWLNSLSYTAVRSANRQDYINSFYLPSLPQITGNGKTINNKDIYVLQSDLTWNFKKKYKLETGFKISNSRSANTANYFLEDANGNKETDSLQTNTFRYKEDIAAFYFLVSKRFYGFTLKPGFRLEHTNIRGNQLIPTDTSFAIKRNDFFPNVFLQHNIFSVMHTVLVANLIYRKSISRPYYESLNPYSKYIDQYLYSRGNPALRPQFTTNYEMNVTFEGFPVFAAGINRTKDIISNVTYQDTTNGIAYQTYDNLGKNKEYYFRVLGGIPPGHKYFFYVGGRYNYNIYNGQYQGKPLDYSYHSWVFFMYQEFKILPTLKISTQGFLRTKGLQNFYELQPFGGLYLAVTQSLFNKKLEVTLSGRDVLHTNPTNFTLDQGDIFATGTSAQDSRRIGLNIRYNFGIKKKESDSKKFGAPVEGNGS